MTPLLLFLLALAGVYVGTVATAFSALMRLSLRLMAEGGGRHDALGRYLEEPLRLFIPARILLALITVLAAGAIATLTGIDLTRGLPLLIVSTLGFALVCEHFVPLIIVRRDPERVLEVLLPSFEAFVKVLTPLTTGLVRLGFHPRERPKDENGEQPAEPEAEDEQPRDDRDVLQEGQARELLRALVEFRETMVREVMTPRPDVVAIEDSATIGDLQALGREQQYSRMPVFSETLDNIVGMVSIKDLFLMNLSDPSQPIAPLIRPAHFVPESKRVLELLQELQKKRLQAAVVVDEYGGVAGLVTIEDLLEEIVGEILDEYDVEIEPVREEADGSFVFSGRTHVRELAERLSVSVEGEGYETVGGYVLAHVGRVPAAGERFEIDGLAMEVLDAERRRITRVRVQRRQEEPVGAEGGE